MLRLLRRRLLRPGDPLRRGVDSTDLLQEAWLSAFEAIKSGAAFPDVRSFAAFRAAVTTNRYRGHYRARHLTEKRSSRHEQSVDPAELASEAPGPDEAAAANDEWAALLARLGPRDRAIVVDLAAGGGVVEVAAGHGVSVRTVERVRERLGRPAGPGRVS